MYRTSIRHAVLGRMCTTKKKTHAMQCAEPLCQTRFEKQTTDHDVITIFLAHQIAHLPCSPQLVPLKRIHGARLVWLLWWTVAGRRPCIHRLPNLFFLPPTRHDLRAIPWCGEQGAERGRVSFEIVRSVLGWDRLPAFLPTFYLLSYCCMLTVQHQHERQ